MRSIAPNRKMQHNTTKIGCFGCIYTFIVAGLCILPGGRCSMETPSSILNPSGPQSGHIAWLTWLMIIVYGIVFVITLLILFLALRARKREKPVLGSRFIVVAGIAIPTLILVIMLFFELRISKKISDHTAESDIDIQVIGHGWWFEVRYPGYNIIDANEIHMPINSMVRFELSSSGMIHSFWVPRLGGKRDQLPDHTNYLFLQADQPGVYDGVCAEYCAGQHARMAFRLVAHTADDFNLWLARYQTARQDVTDPKLISGMNVYLNAGCASCHAISGLSNGNTGPDLTHLGSRLTIGAGQFDNNFGSLSGWIANSQALKPSNLMPRTYLKPEDLHALVEYLRSLQ